MDKAKVIARMKTIWQNAKIVCFIFFIILGIVFVGVVLGSLWQFNYDKKQMQNYTYEVMRHEALLNYQECKSKLVKEVSAYIDSIAPTSSLTGYAVVENCEKYDLDIKFLLAQGQIESKFGTCGMATKTNSVFNVGAFDKSSYDQINGKYKYEHPDFSIEPYIQLLYKDYITATKTELDLMIKYVNKNGQRYASNPDYETHIFNLYEKIDANTNISELQGELRRYKIVLGD